MGTTIHSSTDLSSVLGWPESQRPTEAPQELAHPCSSQGSLDRLGAVQELPEWKPAPAGGSHKFLVALWKSAAEAVRAAAKVAQNQAPTQVFSEREVKIISENLTTLKEWLTEALRGVREADRLPHVKMPEMEHAVPRTFALACAFLQSTGFEFEEDSFEKFLAGTQKKGPLEMAEIWNLKPLLGLALLREFTQEMKKSRVRESDPQTANPPTLDGEPSRLPFLLDALAQVAGMEWKVFFERACLVEQTLRADPQGAYPKMDYEAREVYRAAVAEFAEHSGASETEIAQRAVALAQRARQDLRLTQRAQERREHVGYYLVDNGQTELKREIGYTPSIGGRIRDAVLKSPDLIYVLGIEFVTVAILVLLVPIFHLKFSGLLGLALIAFPALECAVALVNMVATRLVPPKRIPRLDFSKGIPASCATVVAVPALLTSEAQVRRVVQGLEIRYLANRDANLHFALLSDLPDSTEQFDECESLVQLSSRLVQNLDAKYARDGKGRFFLFHRHRKYNAAEGLWMGWERKRGKLLDFNRFLLNQGDEFPVKAGEISFLRGIRYVITLDLDTQLPPGAARKLVGTLAHPLNRAVIDPYNGTVVEGYGILQPRVDISVKSASRSRFASLLSGDTGFDIYTRAVSDVYQDLFGEGIFAGKGIYEVETFQKVLEHRFPCNAILSHDLIEGAYARAGLVSDIEIVDDYPSHFSAFSRRRHRWVRGDWQILFSLLPKFKDYFGDMVFNPLNYISRWKVFDNLRRSLTDVAIMLLLFYGWFLSPNAALRCTLAVLALMLFPVCFQPLLAVLTAGKTCIRRDFWQSLGRDFVASLARICVRLAFLCHQSLIDLDAVVRTVVRMKFTHRKLLEWETSADAELTSVDHVVDAYLKYSLLIIIGMGSFIYFLHRGSFAVALPLLTAWAASTWIVDWLNQPQHSKASLMKAEDRDAIRNAALRTWRFFSEFSNPAENWLIPDIVQEAPPLVAHRISPTNLGLLLNSRLAAHDLGYLTTEEFIRVTERTLETVQRMPKSGGHFYNWYENDSLAPVAPLFVSTADNGNLAASLWTLKQGCLDMIQEPLIHSQLWAGLRDIANQLSEAVQENCPESDLIPVVLDLQQRADEVTSADSLLVGELRAIEIDALLLLDRTLKGRGNEDVAWWARESAAHAHNLLNMIEMFAPWQTPEWEGACPMPASEIVRLRQKLTLEAVPRAYREISKKLDALRADGGSAEMARHFQAVLDKSARLAEDLVNRLTVIACTAQSLADGMDFSVLIDEKKKQFSIGYEEGEGTISKYNYDLLASEARTAVFIAIAKGEASHEIWFRLKRSYRTFKREDVLLSWSGTMFEYLMPCLWLRRYPNTLLGQGIQAILRAQQKFGDENGIPWGISESSCADRNPDGHYRYHAFGVPGLALHRDDCSDDLVVAPYATFLGMMFDLNGALKNLRRMKDLGLLSAYGFYEAADFTPKRNGGGAKHIVVRNWMAHHQGMSLVAAANVLCDFEMQRRFHAEPRVAAIERVLHERQPRVLPYEDIEEAMEESGLSLADMSTPHPVFRDSRPKPYERSESTAANVRVRAMHARRIGVALGT